MKKLAIVTTHPIQYYAPVFKLLHERNKIEIMVFYTWGENSISKHDPGFEKSIEWDLPLLEGYPYEWAVNTSRDPGSHHYYGIKNPDLIRQIQVLKPDAVLVFGWAYQSHLKVLRHFKGKLPVYFRGDSTLLDDSVNFKNVLKKWLLKWVYSHVDHVFFVGSANKKYFLRYGINNSQLSCTPHAVDNTRFEEDRTKEAKELRKQLGLSLDNVLVLFAGKFEPKKDPLFLLNAIQMLNNDNVHLLLVGNGVLETTLKFATLSGDKASSNIHHIHFMDFQNQTQMPVLYQASDLFCLPSKGPGESWGLAINEAMACGKAILSSDKVGATYDLVEEGKNGLIFKSGNLTDIREKLEHLTVCKSRLEEYGKRSKEIIKERNFGTIAHILETTLNNV